MYLWLFRILMAIAVALNLYGTSIGNEQMVSFADWLFLLFTSFTIGCVIALCLVYATLFATGQKVKDMAKNILAKNEERKKKSWYGLRVCVGRIWLFGFMAFMAYSGSPILATLSIVFVLMSYGVNSLIMTKVKDVVAKEI